MRILIRPAIPMHAHGSFRRVISAASSRNRLSDGMSVLRRVLLSVAIALGLSLCIDGVAYETNALISLRQDYSGFAARTWELSLLPDGSVVEETYNIDAKDIDRIDVVNTVRKVSREQVPQLVSQAANLMKSLPEDADETIVLDPETKAIRVRTDAGKLFAGWSSYETTPHEKTKAFEHAWEAIKHLLRNPEGSPERK